MDMNIACLTHDRLIKGVVRPILQIAIPMRMGMKMGMRKGIKMHKEILS